MKPFNSLLFVLAIVFALFSPSWPLSLAGQGTVSRSNVTDNLDSSVQSLFNMTYNSRLLYRLRQQVNSLDQSESKISRSCQTVLQTLLNAPTAHRWSLSSKWPISISLQASCSNAKRNESIQFDTHQKNLCCSPVLDANAPMPSSLLWDQITSVGGYDQCLAIDDVHNEVTIHGKVCWK